MFLVVAPGTVAGLIPWWISEWRIQSPPVSLQAVGILLAVAGAAVLLDSFARFAIQGLGTPAPIFATRHLVVRGFYRYTRNPMYLAVVSVILGQGFFFGDPRLLAYGALVWLGFHLFVVFYEEPTLGATFGREYEDYRAHVPRWLPSLQA